MGILTSRAMIISLNDLQWRRVKLEIHACIFAVLDFKSLSNFKMHSNTFFFGWTMTAWHIRLFQMLAIKVYIILVSFLHIFKNVNFDQGKKK